MELLDYMILLERNSVGLIYDLCVKVIDIQIIQNSTSPLEWNTANCLPEMLTLLHGMKSVLTSLDHEKSVQATMNIYSML